MRTDTITPYFADYSKVSLSKYNPYDWEAAWTSPTGDFNSQCVAGNYPNTVQKAFLYFDSSTLSNGNLISIKLRLYGMTAYYDPVAGESLIIQNGQPTYPHVPLEVGDYGKVNYGGNGGEILSSAWSTNDWNEITLTDLSWINLSGWTKLCLRVSTDINGVQPGTALDFRFAGPNDYGGIYTPELSVTWYRLEVGYCWADSIADEGADLWAAITDAGATDIASCYFEYGRDISYGSTTVPQNVTTGMALWGTISGLIPGTTYHFRAVAVAGGETAYGADVEFTTSGVDIRTLEPQVGITDAILWGFLSGICLGTVGFDYKKSVDSEWTRVSVGAYSGEFAEHVTGLTAATAYDVRAYYIDDVAVEYYGDTLQFTTGIATCRCYTVRQNDKRGKPIFLAECKAINMTTGVLIDTKYTFNGLAVFNNLPNDAPVDVEVHWAKQFRLYQNVYESGGDEIETMVTVSHAQNTDDYTKGVQVTTEPATPATGRWYVG